MNNQSICAYGIARAIPFPCACVLRLCPYALGNSRFYPSPSADILHIYKVKRFYQPCNQAFAYSDKVFTHLYQTYFKYMPTLSFDVSAIFSAITKYKSSIRFVPVVLSLYHQADIKHVRMLCANLLCFVTI